jgi:hypothetical protein
MIKRKKRGIIINRDDCCSFRNSGKRNEVINLNILPNDIIVIIIDGIIRNLNDGLKDLL